MAEPSHYELLGVSEDATPGQIKKAWRRRARELHPDSRSAPDVAEFRRCRAAYEELSDRGRRDDYDREYGFGRYREANEPVGQGDRATARPNENVNAYPVDPTEHLVEEPLPIALGRLLGRLVAAGLRHLPTVLRRAPRIAIICGLLVGGAFIGSWALRSYSRYSADAKLASSFPGGITDCDTGSLLSVQGLPHGARARVTCQAGPHKATYLDFGETDVTTSPENSDLGVFFSERAQLAQQQGVSVTSTGEGGCATPGHTAPYRYQQPNSDPRHPLTAALTDGMVLCFMSSRGRRSKVHFEWSDYGSGVYGEAALSQASYAAIYEWWKAQAGPSPMAGGISDQIRVYPKVG